MPTASANCSGKIWFFANHDIDITVINDTEQQLTIKLIQANQSHNFFVALVYAKCNANDRLQLWEDVDQLTTIIREPWLIGGDLNVILNSEEKIGGLPVHAADYEDFETWISSCDLQEVNFKGSPYTWWNGRAGKDCIFERHRKPFRFLKFWTENDTFTEVVRLNWCTTSSHNPYLDFKENIKCMKVSLTRWSRKAYGDIFKQLLIREDIMKIKEKLFEEEPFVINREVLQRAQAEYKKYIHFEKKFWQQKTGYDWLENGDRNTRFFHSIVKVRRKRLHIQGMQNRQGDWLENYIDIVSEAVSFFQEQFSQEAEADSFELLRYIPEVIFNEENVDLCRFNEVKKAIFGLYEDSGCGPDEDFIKVVGS
ncbi:uncharacterized protein [Solanum tuberosum]|uniref:uncharacterized protein n=1 Tax=Solanum tuberosum TaxID=4113 RepID=UPI00073A50D9|nr:PREDICTED: uncharacterized protein LOC107062348 [Solanum tuberosum]